MTPDCGITSWLVFRAGLLLLAKDCGRYRIPECADAPFPLAEGASIFEVESASRRRFHAYAGDTSAPLPAGLEEVPLRSSYFMLTRDEYDAAGKASEIIHWDAKNKFCGICGGPLNTVSRTMKRCSCCGEEVFPSISPAIIVRVDRGNSVLMARARNFKGTWYGLVSGFVEFGESLEECVERELFEETGLKVRGIKYFGSQPWPYPCGIMLGFTANYESGELRICRDELVCADFFTADSMPELPQKLSIARRLVDDWLSSHRRPPIE